MFSAVERLNLSSNFLQSLQGLQQFQKLRFLDISHNFLAEILELVPLSQLPCLETLDLRENPVNFIAETREFVLAMAPNLRVFNEKVRIFKEKPAFSNIRESIAKKKLNADEKYKEKRLLLSNYSRITWNLSACNR